MRILPCLLLLLSEPAVALAQKGGDAADERLRNQPYTYCALRPYNVIADGATDQTIKVQRCLTALTSTGGTAVLPLGQVVVNGSGITVPAGVGLVGQGQYWPYIITRPPNTGTTIYSPHAFYGSGETPVVTLKGRNTLAHLVIYGPGSDGYGSGTERPNIYLAGAQNYITDVTSMNSYRALSANYQAANFISASQFRQSAVGIVNPVDSHISNSSFGSNGTDVDLQPGANMNTWAENRFEWNKTGPSLSAWGCDNNHTYATSNSTSSSSNVLHFGSTPLGVLQGYMIADTKNAGAVAYGTYVTSASPSQSLNMSANAMGTGVATSDNIVFYNPRVKHNEFVGNQWDRAFTNAVRLHCVTNFVFNGNTFNRSGAGATANTSDDAHILLQFTDNVVITGNTFAPEANDGGSGAYSPSYGIWDNGQNFNDIISDNTIVWNPVDGTNGNGINSTTTFKNFNTQNSIARANPYIKGLP